MKIPFVDLHAQYLAHKAEFDAAIHGVIDATAFIGGESVREFEAKFAAASGAKHCIAVANGTDAIYIVLKMLGIGAGDEVITTAGSWISTSETISQTGAEPVFVDVDDYFNIDARLLERRINSRTKAVIPVHLYGQAAEVETILEMTSRHGIALIEDCAQAHLAERHGRKVGTFGGAGTFSFYPGKNLGAYGDAGAIITNSDALAVKCRRYANHGALEKHHHDVEGINSRMDGIQAALLSAKLRHLVHWTEMRRQVAARYDEKLARISAVKTPRVRQGSTHVYHLYVVECDRRDELRLWLKESDIETAVHYPTALPLLPAYARLGVRLADIPRAGLNQGRILSLPIFPEMTHEMIDFVASRIDAFYDR
jgi:dTDP-4-amino-4,6-dideoxygalactose transaminase